MGKRKEKDKARQCVRPGNWKCVEYKKVGIIEKAQKKEIPFLFVM